MISGVYEKGGTSPTTEKIRRLADMRTKLKPAIKASIDPYT